ncbi:MAG: Nramp family divalent metal transporter [Dongiaceae bacterium]
MAVGGAGFWRRLAAFTGPGYLVAVGYMDPGNWATDIAGGSAFGYQLLSVVLLASLMAVVLQALSARLGIASGLDLAQACRAHYPPILNIPLWLLCEVAICACDLAEVLGTAIALQLLLGLPLLAGVCLTVLDALLVLLLQRKGFRPLEAVIGALLLTVGICIGIEWALARPDPAAVLAGFVPRPAIVTDPAMLYLAIGILGATVMPHNLYLHSAIVQTRRFERSPAGRRDAIRFAVIDSTVALTLAMAVNAAILVVAAATFHGGGLTGVADIREAQQLLAPMLGAPAAGLLFALALLASGQNSTVTATLAGQVVMEGFVAVRLPPWLRRLATRLVAIVPAVLVIAVAGESAVGRLLVLSQVVLSLQLPFAVIPLVHLTGRRRVMGSLANPRWLQLLAVAIALILVGLNLKLGFDAVG